jgi:hypothetical protein
MKTLAGLTIAAAGLAALAAPAGAAQCDWRIEGVLEVEHQLTEMKTKFGESSPLANIEVKVSGKTGSALPWGEWGTTRTNSKGEFSVGKNKSCADRYFKVEVQFQDAEIELRHENATSSLDKVKWYEAWNSANFGNKRHPNVVDVGTLRFGPGAGVAGKSERGDFQVYRHAEMWSVYKLLNAVLEDYGPEYDFERKLIVKYPHNSWIVGDNVEGSYFNPITKIGYIHRDPNSDDFSMSTLIHEALHGWAYDKFDGEGCLTWDLVLTHDTHDLAANSCPAFHEGFADAAQERFEYEQFGETMQLPYDRARLAQGGGLLSQPIPRPNLVERLDEGWSSVLLSMMNEHLATLKFGDADDTPGFASAGSFLGECNNPAVTLQRLMKVFLADASHGYLRDLDKDETSMRQFLNRADAILANFDPEHVDVIIDMHDSRKTGEPSDVLCEKFVLEHQQAPGQLSDVVFGPLRR